MNVRGDTGELVAAFKEALGTQDAARGSGDVRGPRRRHLHVHDVNRVRGGRAAEEEPHATLRCLLRHRHSRGLHQRVPCHLRDACQRWLHPGQEDQARPHRVHTHGRDLHEACPGERHAPKSLRDDCRDASAADKITEWQPGRLRPGCGLDAGVAVRPQGVASMIVAVFMLREV